MAHKVTRPPGSLTSTADATVSDTSASNPGEAQRSPLRIASVDDARLDSLLPLTPVVFHVLLALARGPAHGYAIAGEVEEVTSGRVRMGPGTLYGSLQRMRDEGLLEEAENPGEEGAHAGRRRYYALTPLGRAALRAEGERLGKAARLVAARLEA
ncbi:MAG: PadR family transcriptional regulator [Gemmatimonadetes bacterium]|nr:PadR family transcriptional regulator [Gemmatimonadota bacterium]